MESYNIYCIKEINQIIMYYKQEFEFIDYCDEQLKYKQIHFKYWDFYIKNYHHNRLTLEEYEVDIGTDWDLVSFDLLFGRIDRPLLFIRHYKNCINWNMIERYYLNTD